MDEAEGRPNIKNVINMCHYPDFTGKTYPDDINKHAADVKHSNSICSPSSAPSSSDDDDMSL